MDLFWKFVYIRIDPRIKGFFRPGCPNVFERFLLSSITVNISFRFEFEQSGCAISVTSGAPFTWFVNFNSIAILLINIECSMDEISSSIKSSIDEISKRQTKSQNFIEFVQISATCKYIKAYENYDATFIRINQPKSLT